MYYGKIKYKKVQSNRSKLKIYLIKKTSVSLCKSQKSYFHTIVFYMHFSALLSDLWQLVRQINWLSPWFSANDRQREEREFLSKPSSSFWSCNVLALFRVLLFNFNSLITSPGCFSLINHNSFVLIYLFWCRGCSSLELNLCSICVVHFKGVNSGCTLFHVIYKHFWQGNTILWKVRF